MALQHFENIDVSSLIRRANNIDSDRELQKSLDNVLALVKQMISAKPESELDMIATTLDFIKEFKHPEIPKIDFASIGKSLQKACESDSLSQQLEGQIHIAKVFDAINKSTESSENKKKRKYDCIFQTLCDDAKRKHY